MSLNHSPSVVTNGLIMYYDMNNTRKSWLGAPVTNYIANPYASHNGSSFVNFGYNYPNLGATYTYVAGVDNPINSPGVLEYYTGTTGYKYFSIDSQTLPTTGTYTFSYYARLKISGSASNKPIDNQLWRANGSDRSVTGDWNPTFTSDWVRYSTTGPAEASTILQYFPAHSGTIIGGYTIQYCGFQLELGSVATPFVVGTRSNTQAVVDLTGNNTITATSLTYASDNTFSFNGSNNYMTVPVSSVLNMPSSFTLEAWVRPNSATSDRAIIILGTGSYYLTIDNAYKLSVYCYGKSPAGYHTTSESVSQGVWNHICAAWSSGEVSLYINGQLKISISTTGTPNAVSSQLWIGAEGSGASRQLNGSIGIAKIYNRALSAGEVAQNFNALRGRYGV